LTRFRRRFWRWRRTRSLIRHFTAGVSNHAAGDIVSLPVPGFHFKALERILDGFVAVTGIPGINNNYIYDLPDASLPEPRESPECVPGIIV
jgi:hypothetical protein